MRIEEEPGVEAGRPVRNLPQFFSEKLSGIRRAIGRKVDGFEKYIHEVESKGHHVGLDVKGEKECQ